jgi:hypothetical protein
MNDLPGLDPSREPFSSRVGAQAGDMSGVEIQRSPVAPASGARAPAMLLLGARSSLLVVMMTDGMLQPGRAWTRRLDGCPSLGQLERAGAIV